ncbi:MAG: hypothetical protein KF819_21195 [Labilithrix sp.]|nr:hypothetical protein [Labilithrix sp.]
MSLARAAVAIGAIALAACTRAPASSGAGAGAAASTTSPSPPPAASAASDAGAVVDLPPDAAAPAPPEIPEPTFDEILRILFAERTSADPIVAACPASLPGEARVRCLYDERYKGDAKAASLAHELYVKWRIIAGVEVAHTMDGGFRGLIKLEPGVAVGENRKHLEWVAGAMRDFDAFFVELDKFRVDHGGVVSAAKPYRFRPIILRFMKSMNVRRPSAYAHDWTVAYNFNGSLNLNGEAVRETMFHEIFHLNDAAHGWWSREALEKIFQVPVKKCGTNIPCLAPFTPNETIVVGGTYYAFQPGNGVVEYAAELALRYYREQRAALRSLPKVKPFKCGPPENAKAWALMKDEFFAGVDAVPPCS